MKFSFHIFCCFSLFFLINVVVLKLSKIRRTKNDSVLRGFYPGDEKTVFSHNLGMVARYRKLNLNPLSFQLGLHKYGECI